MPSNKFLDSKKIFSSCVLLLGVVCVIYSVFLVYQRTVPLPLEITSQTSSKHTPTILSIPSLAIKLSIYESAISKGRWEETSKGVSFLKTSSIPGEAGNSIIYGHNWPNIFGALPNLTIGDVITIAFSDGSSADFSVIKTSVVDGDDIGVLKPKHQSQVILYTCTGFLDTKRFVVTAVPLVK